MLRGASPRASSCCLRRAERRSMNPARLLGPAAPVLVIALRALSRNKLQTALTTLGMTIGVATVLTMIALGTGAQAAIEQQVRAAGMNLIVVTAGNYKVKTEDDGGGVVDHQALRRQPSGPVGRVV